MVETCPCCGARSSVADPLVAACDVLVRRALELIGKRLQSAERSRYSDPRMAGRSVTEAHLVWQPTPAQVDKALASAWGMVPDLVELHGCCGTTPDEVVAVLDRYVRDLVVTMAGHDPDELRYRLAAYLGVPA